MTPAQRRLKWVKKDYLPPPIKAILEKLEKEKPAKVIKPKVTEVVPVVEEKKVDADDEK